MGSACCVAARDIAEVPRRTSSQGGFRNVGYSPAWNCRWDSQGGRVAEEVQNTTPFLYSHGNSMDFGSTTMDSVDVECGDLSERQSQVDFQTSIQQNSPSHEDTGLNSMSSPSEPSMGSGSLNEVSFNLEHAKDSTGPSPVAGPSQSSPSFPRPPTSTSSSLSNGHSHHPHHSNLRSPNNSISEERESDSWSMSTFSELVASQRERWSFDSENTDTSNGRGKVTRSNTIDLRTCGVCLKLLIEKSPWVAQKFVSNELSVVAVLICGHVYHAECLDNTTPETSRFDPPCPVCTSGDKHGIKIQGKTVRIDTEFKSRNRISRNRVVDSNLGFDYSVPDHWRSSRREGKGPMLGSSSSMKSSFSKPFLRRHFSLGSKSSNSKAILENEFSIKSPKKGFWSRYRKG